MTIENKTREKETGRSRLPDLPSLLAYLYAPLLPHLKNLKIERSGPRKFNPRDILLPEGYTAEVVATGLNAPVHCTFDPEGFCYVAESGHKIDSPPRIIKIDPRSGESTLVYQVPEDQWNLSGALTGVSWYNGYLYFTNTDSLNRIHPGGEVVPILTGLPGKGDHQTNHPVIGPDGKIYYGQGTATNAGVVGADNFAFEWLAKYPGFCDIPARDIVLYGQNYEYQNVLGSITERITTGAYVPFGTETHTGQIIKGDVRCTGAVMRCNPDGSDLEVVAWGLRNPYGLAFHPDGRLFATEHGMDERGKRYILNDPDDFYEIIPGKWYGWPDYASGIRLDDPYWGEGGMGRRPVLAEHPDPEPPKPFVRIEAHDAANGFEFCRRPEFGFEGDAFVACFGDLAPITTVTQSVTPMGFKVVRIDMKNGRVYDFAVNRIAGPASKLPHSGFERPSHCAFGPDGALYVVDFGEIELAPEKGAIRMKKGTGSLWRIRRTASPQGMKPAKPVKLPLYLIQLAAVIAAIGGGIFLLRALVNKIKDLTGL